MRQYAKEKTLTLPRSEGLSCAESVGAGFAFVPHDPACEVGVEGRRKKGGRVDHKEEELTQGIHCLPRRLQ
jgi:hypothetical protein